MIDDVLIPTALQPLNSSHRDDDFEDELYRLFQDIFEGYIRAEERDLNVHAAPHLGSFDLVSRSVERDGLSLINNEDEAAMRYLFKAWKARNPKRGLAFVKTYLKLLFDGNAEAFQMWHDKDYNYPQGLLDSDNGNAFLTSRIRVVFKDLIERETISEDINRVAPAIKSALAIRFLLEIYASIEAEAKQITRSALVFFEVDSDKEVHVSHEIPAQANQSPYLGFITLYKDN